MEHKTFRRPIGVAKVSVFMSGIYESNHQLLLRLMMRAIDHAELSHEINNACASVAANLTYIGIQCKTLLESNESSTDALKETYTEFTEISEESLDAIRRVTKSLGQPQTGDSTKAVEIQADQLLIRLVGCIKDYLPGHELHLKTAPIQISAVYYLLVSHLLLVVLACIDARKDSSAPEKRRLDLELHAPDADHCRLSISPHLDAAQASHVEDVVRAISDESAKAMYEVRLINASTQPIIEFSFARVSK